MTQAEMALWYEAVLQAWMETPFEKEEAGTDYMDWETFFAGWAEELFEAAGRPHEAPWR